MVFNIKRTAVTKYAHWQLGAISKGICQYENQNLTPVTTKKRSESTEKPYLFEGILQCE